MRVVLDTNILCADFRLKGNDFRVFLEGMQRVGIQICLPKVVIDEVTYKYWQKLFRIADESLRICQKWQQAIGIPTLPPISFESANAEATKYKKYLLKTLDTYKTTILPYPDTSHEVIAQRAIEHRKPFKEKGAGYRDTLIWESILSLLNDDTSPIYFVTNNSKDFGGGPKVHSELLQDLDHLNIKYEDVKVFKTLKDLNRELIIPSLEHLEELIKKFSNDEVPEFSLGTWVEDELCYILDTEGVGWSLVDLEGLNGTDIVCEVVAIDDVFSVEINDIRKLPSGDLLIVAIAKVSVGVNVIADINEYYTYDKVQEFFGYLDPPSRGGMVEHLEEYTSIDQSISFNLIIEKESYNVISAKIDQLTNYSLTEQQKNEQIFRQRRLVVDDKVSDVMAVLTVMRRKFKRTSNHCNFAELRKEAVEVVAEIEYSRGRYKNLHSAQETINDAYSRRLKLSRAKFDGLTEQWLRHNSMQLKEILLRHSKSPSQSDEVTVFFEEEN